MGGGGVSLEVERKNKGNISPTEASLRKSDLFGLMTRRQLLALGGTVTAAVVLEAIFTKNTDDVFRTRGAIEDDTRTIFPLSQDELDAAEKRLNTIESQAVEEAATTGNLDSIKTAVSSEAFQETKRIDLEARARQQYLGNHLAQEGVSNMRFLINFPMMVFSGLLGGFGVISYLDRRAITKEKIARLAAVIDAEGVQIPSGLESRSFLQGLALLPHLSGSVIPKGGFWMNNVEYQDRGYLSPSLTTESLLNKTKDTVDRASFAEANSFVCKLSVPGQMTDDSKLWPMLQISSDEISRNWEVPFNKSGLVKRPWFHDNSQPNLWNLEGRNPLWEQYDKQFDRTGYIFEIGNRLPEIEYTEKIARRLQCYAVAFHARNKTAPGEMPGGIRKKLAADFNQFNSEAQNFLTAFGLDHILSTPWFKEEAEYPDFVTANEVPLTGGVNPRRFETPFDPIQNDLLELEGVKKNNLGFRVAAARVLDNLVARVDHTLGLAV